MSKSQQKRINVQRGGKPMTDEIQEQINMLRNQPGAVFGTAMMEAADTMAKLLAVYERACFLPLKADGWAHIYEVKRLQEALDQISVKEER